jgi:hypothetical protein
MNYSSSPAEAEEFMTHPLPSGSAMSLSITHPVIAKPQGYNFQPRAHNHQWI